MQMGNQDGSASAGGPGGEDYDLLPYPSMPYPHTQPAHLAALATLFGLEAPPPDRGRILELGCASGGNIIPLAVRFPDARFLGIDLSRRHIDDGRRRISALGLTNIELRHEDVTHAAFGADRFDYVICHGVYSWVAQATQNAILQICGESLAANGVAIVSYNVLPGWHLRRIVRDICLYHAGKEGPPRDRVARARQVLAHIAESADKADPYGLLLRTEAARIARRPASYILGEFLVPDNAPCYFHEFVDRAGRHALSHLCDGELSASRPDILDPSVEDRVRAISGSSPTAFEQNIDFLTGRTFRSSVLVTARQAAGAGRAARPERLRGLHFASQLRFDPTQSNEGVSSYRDPRGRGIRATDPAVRHALARLAEHYPATVTLGQLTPRPDGQDQAEAEARICKALFLLVSAGQASASALPLRVGRATAERPRAWALARNEAAAGQPWITTLRHTAVPLRPATAVLLAHLDGAHDRHMLKARLVDAVGRRELRVPELRTEQTPGGEERLETAAAQYVERTLDYLALHSLLDDPEGERLS